MKGEVVRDPDPLPDDWDGWVVPRPTPDIDDIVGMTTLDAKAYLQDIGHTMRVMILDGQSLIGTADFRSNRVNVAVEADVVVKVLDVA